MSNAYWETLDFELPPVPEAAVSGWQRWIDTARESPDDIMDPATAPLVTALSYAVAPRSVVALFVRVAIPAASALDSAASATSYRHLADGRGARP